MYRFLKYRLRLMRHLPMRHLPGAVGSHYMRKYKRKRNEADFKEAVHRCRGTTCIDLGANLGVYTRMMASHAKRVIAFEPDPWTLAKLRANVADFDNVTIENAAAGTSEQSTYLYRHPGFEEDPVRHSVSSSVIAGKCDVVKEDVIEIRQVDFLRYLEDLDSDIGILKIDIEGAEVPLLEALFDRSDLMGAIGHIFAETHEIWIPAHKPRVKALRAKARRIEQPLINLDWH